MESNNNENKKTVHHSTPIDTSFGHLQPQATDLERVVLGALMIDSDAFSMVSETLHAETFYEQRNQKIYHAIQSLSMDEKPVDIMTVTEQLKREGTLDEVGGASYIVELSSQVASSVNIEFHAKILQQKYLARQLISYASRLETDAFDETIDVEELMQKAEGSLFELSQKNLRQDYTQIDPILSEAVDILQKASATTGGLTGIPSGFERLDETTAGWQKSDLIIIAGRPAMGKTAFALSIVKNIAVDYQAPVAFFSLEMNKVQLVNRLIANVCEITGNKILSGQLTDDEWKRLDSKIRLLTGAPIYIDDTPGLSIFELRTKARRLVREEKVKLIVIDYLQLMNANGMRFGNRQEEVSTISRSLKGLAKELNIPIIALSQLNRVVENREGNGSEGKRPQLSDLRESGAIEQDADMVILLHRPEYYGLRVDDKGNDWTGKAQIIIAKHRKGATKDIVLRFHGEYTRFENPDDSTIISSKMNDNSNNDEAPLGEISSHDQPDF